MSNADNLIQTLKTARDELKLKIHLGSKDAQDEFQKLEAEWNDFKEKHELDEKAAELSEEIADASEDALDALKAGYAKLREELAD